MAPALHERTYRSFSINALGHIGFRCSIAPSCRLQGHTFPSPECGIAFSFSGRASARNRARARRAQCGASSQVLQASDEGGLRRSGGPGAHLRTRSGLAPDPPHRDGHPAVGKRVADRERNDFRHAALQAG